MRLLREIESTSSDNAENVQGTSKGIPAEEALWEAEGKWRSLVENAPDVVGPSSPVRSNEIKKQGGKG